jgi:hypothetical protein
VINLGSFLLQKYIHNLNFELLLSTEKAMYLRLQKMRWATFWAIFSQTHLVALSLLLRKIA